MKAKFLDIRNCRALMANAGSRSVLERLEYSLNEANERTSELAGCIDRLIERNVRTQGKGVGFDRLLKSPVQIAQFVDYGTGWINTQMTLSALPLPASLHSNQRYGEKLGWKTIIPLQFLLKGWGDASDGYQCYVHSISHNLADMNTRQEYLERQFENKDDYYYVGITGRQWLKRLKEHLREMDRGSRKSFHETWKKSLGFDGVLFTSHLRDINRSYQDAMEWEEDLVDRIASDQYGLNMISGGYKGLKELHKLGLIARQDVTLEERDQAIATYARQNRRKGKPNPFIAEWWKSDEHYEQVNAAHPKRLSGDEVREIRRLHATGKSDEEILEISGARNLAQVKGITSGRTYKRIK